MSVNQMAYDATLYTRMVYGSSQRVPLLCGHPWGIGYILLLRVKVKHDESIGPNRRVSFVQISVDTLESYHIIFQFFNLVFVSCLLDVIKKLITENNKNIYMIHIYRGEKI